MGRGECAQKGGALVALEAVDGPEGGPEGSSEAVEHAKVGDVREDALVAAADPALLVEDGGAEEPMACGEDEVVELVDLGRPVLVELVEVEAEEARVGRPVRVRIVPVLDEVRRPKRRHAW